MIFLIHMWFLGFEIWSRSRPKSLLGQRDSGVVWVSFGVSLVWIWEKIDRVIAAARCILITHAIWMLRNDRKYKHISMCPETNSTGINTQLELLG